MHELSVTAQIVDQLREQLMLGDFKRITQVNMVIGDLAGVDGECIRYYFGLLSKDTPAAKANLNFKIEESEFRCRQCHCLYRRREDFLCPHCGGPGEIARICNSLYIESIEVE